MKNQNIHKLSIQLIRLKLEGKNILALYVNDSNNIVLDQGLIKKINILEDCEIINIKDNQNNKWEVSSDREKFTFFDLKNYNYFCLTSDDINYHGYKIKIC